MDLALKEFYSTSFFIHSWKVYISFSTPWQRRMNSQRVRIYLQVDFLFCGPCRLFVIWACFFAGTSVLATFFHTYRATEARRRANNWTTRLPILRLFTLNIFYILNSVKWANLHTTKKWKETSSNCSLNRFARHFNSSVMYNIYPYSLLSTYVRA
jgi:hypothetical protein